MQLTITMSLDNAAMRDELEPDFGDGTAIAEILRKVAGDFDGGYANPGSQQPLRDANGSTIGQVTVTD